jgi:hypothetical protein
MGTKVDWRALFTKALETAAKKAGFEAPKFEDCTTNNTWGDRVGLVFYGSTPEVNERAAKFFEAWASKYLRKLGAVGGYDAQGSIGYSGAFHYVRYDNKAAGWYRGAKNTDKPGEVKATKEVNGYDLKCVETRDDGHATSYVYYPCAD